jgi:hypothetical protein
MKVAITSHNTVLTIEDGHLCHRNTTTAFSKGIDLFIIKDGENKFKIGDKELEIFISWDGQLVIKSGSLFGCADPNRLEIIFDRKDQGAWETFEIREKDSYLRQYKPYEKRLSDAEMLSFMQGSLRLLDLRPDSDGFSRVDGIDAHAGHVQSQISSVLTGAAIDTSSNEKFDRIILHPRETHEQTISLISNCINALSADGTILVEKYNNPDAARAIVKLAEHNIARPILPDSQKQSPNFQFISPIRRKGTGAKKIILVAVFGFNARAEWAISNVTTADYARRIGAELLVIEEELLPTERLLAKVRALDHAPAGARVLLLDTDIIIRDSAPDIFEIVPDAAIGVFIESLHVDRGGSLDNALSFFNISSAQPYYANTGVLLLPPEAVGQFKSSEMPSIMYIDEMYEQNYFNAIFHRNQCNIFNISSLFNCMSAVTPQDISEAYFIHFAGGSTTLQTYIVWEETYSPKLGITIRGKRHMTPKDVRVFDLRNERASSKNNFDTLLSANRAQTADAKLILRSGKLFYECPPGTEKIVLFFPVGKIKPGTYKFEIILSEKSLEDYLYMSPKSDTLYVSNIDRIKIEISSGGARKNILQESYAEIYDGKAGFEAVIDGEQEIGCFIYGATATVEVYGLRVWEVAASLAA